MRRLGIWLSAFLIAGSMASAIGVIYVKYLTRLLFIDLQALRAQREEVDVEWDNLRLEQAALTTNALVERRARQQLEMHLPVRGDIRIIDGGRP